MSKDEDLKRKREIPLEPLLLHATGPIKKRQIIRDDYLRVVEDVMYPSQATSAYGFNSSEKRYPLHRVASLGYLMSPLRKPTVLEKWNPYEVSIFESSITLFGKQFHQIREMIKTKTVKEVVEFYYEWKKSNHYKMWKKSYIPDERDTPTVIVED